MSIGNIYGLIQDWKKDKRRFRGRTFARNLKGYQQFVAMVASQFIPQIREFITAEHPLRKEALKAWKQLIAELEEDMRMLDAFDPTGKTQFFAAIVIAQGIMRDKKAQKAFEQSKTEPVDAFGNPEFISGLAAALDTILDQTYHALRGMVGKDLRLSLVRKASYDLHSALSKGLVGYLSEAKTLLLPQLAVVEMEIEKFLIKK